MQPLQLMINKIINSNPQAMQLYNTLKDKTPAELEQFARNAAQSRGVDLKQFLGNYGINI